MKKFLSLFLCISLLITALSGCSVTNTNSSSSQDPSAVSSQALQATNKDSSIAFEELCNDIFLRMITSDTITLNFNVAYPENFGIEKQTPTLGEYTISNMYEDLAYYENKLQTLFAINKESLSENDKLTYDILIETIECYQKTGSFVLYSEPLSPTTGIQAQLPVLLAEFHFYNTSTIEDYLAMLECVPKYFSQILEYEKAKKEKGMFMSGEQADEIIKQCKDFIENPDENYLIEIFEDNIGDIDELSEEQFTQYAERNASLIKECLIPAYQSIIDGLTGLKDDSVQTQGLCSLPDGKEYYASLVHFLTNSSRSPKEIYDILETTLATTKKEIGSAIANNPDAYEEISTPHFIKSEPDEIIEYLEEAIKKEYPPLPNENAVTIKYVHPSLEDTLSPAMFITPPMDYDVTNSIYINNASCKDSSLFTTIAHEGFPGHMYQSEYFLSTNPQPLRLMLGFSGWCEGWATYTELFSYGISGISEDASTILQNNKLALLCIYSLLDMGVHYYDWTKVDCAKLLVDNGITDGSVINDVYLAVVSEPALYLKYTLGCIEFLSLRESAESTLGNNFDPVSYHDFILSIGPTWFDILADRVDTWVANQQPK